jgi:hypothetical protein
LEIIMNIVTRGIVTAAAALAAATMGAGVAAADTPASSFATNNPGCLGPLRSAIARGELGGARLSDGTVLPAGFSGSFNPGDHLGTVGEAEFLLSHGFTEDQLADLCASFVRH